MLDDRDVGGFAEEQRRWPQYQRGTRERPIEFRESIRRASRRDFGDDRFDLSIGHRHDRGSPERDDAYPAGRGEPRTWLHDDPAAPVPKRASGQRKFTPSVPSDF